MMKVTVGKYDQNGVTFCNLCCCRWHLQLFPVDKEGFCPCLKKLLARHLQNEREFILLVLFFFWCRSNIIPSWWNRCCKPWQQLWQWVIRGVGVVVWWHSEVSLSNVYLLLRFSFDGFNNSLTSRRCWVSVPSDCMFQRPLKTHWHSLTDAQIVEYILSAI